MIKKITTPMLIPEEMGVSNHVLKAVDVICKEILDNYQSMKRTKKWKPVLDNKNNKIKGALKTRELLSIDGDTNDLFFDELYIDLTAISISNSNISDETIKNSNAGEEELRKCYVDTNTGKILNAKINITLCYRDDNIINNITERMLAHELTHVFETSERTKKNDKRKTKDDLYNSIIHSNLKNSDYIIKKILYLIYCGLYFERNANITALYKELMHSPFFQYENIKNHVKSTDTFKNYISVLKTPNSFITTEDIKNTTIENLKYLTLKLKEFNIRVKEDKISFFDELFKMSKYKCEKIERKIDKLVFKVYKDKNPSLLQEEEFTVQFR